MRQKPMLRAEVHARVLRTSLQYVYYGDCAYSGSEVLPFSAFSTSRPRGDFPPPNPPITSPFLHHAFPLFPFGSHLVPCCAQVCNMCTMGIAPRSLSPSKWRTRTRTNTNPNDTEAIAAGRSVRACVARKSKS